MPLNDTLREHLLEVPDGLFATLDGAQFDDLPVELEAKGLTYRPLYLDRGDQDRERASIQLVPLAGAPNSPERAAALAHLWDLVGDRHTAVFWQCPTGEESLYKHLRTINMVLIPKGTDTNEDESEGEASGAGSAVDIVPAGTIPSPTGDATPFPPAESSEQTDGVQPENADYELVLFRHADANVMAQVLPALDKAQFARLFGPATAIAFAPDEEWATSAGMMIAPRPAGLPASAPGPLRLGEDVMERMDRGRLQARRTSIVGYLREVAPEIAESSPESELRTYVDQAEKSAPKLGIATDRGIALWAFMLLITGGAALHDPDILRAFRESGLSGDRVLDEMAEQIVRAPDDSSLWGAS
jgi:hypothetical protein